MINLHLDTDIRTLPTEEAKKKIDNINLVAEHFCNIKFYDECRYCADNALLMAEAINYKRGIAGAKYVLGTMHVKQEDYSEAILVLSEAEKISDEINDLNYTGKVCQKLGFCYWSIGDYTKEIESFFKALNAYNRCGCTKEEADTMNSIGNCYLITKEFNSALEYYKMSIGLKKKLLDVHGIIYSLYNMALTNNNIAAERDFLIDDEEDRKITVSLYNKALQYYFAALEFNTKLEKSNFLEHRILQNIGLTYTNLERAEEAIGLFNKCIDYYEKTQNDGDKCETMINLSVAYLALGREEEATKTLYKAKDLSEKLGLKRISLQVHWHVSKIYETQKNFKAALEHKRIYAELDLEKTKTLVEDKISKLNILHKVEVTKKETQVLSGKNSELKKINEELVKLNTEKNYFLNLAANDLKLPLEKIGNKLKVLERTGKNERVQYLDDILEESSRMEKIISNLLVINESESVK
jgi:tetratricopeptide (TPR) repeat protein